MSFITVSSLKVSWPDVWGRGSDLNEKLTGKDGDEDDDDDDDNDDDKDDATTPLI